MCSGLGERVIFEPLKERVSMNYSIETSENIQEDILTCIEGFSVSGGITDIERLKDALCQIIVEYRRKLLNKGTL